jgi:hypothetical protein
MSHYYRLNSNKQIESLLNSPLKNSLLRFLHSRLGVDARTVFRLFNSSHTEKEFYFKLKKNMRLNFSSKDAMTSRASKRLEDFMRITDELDINPQSLKRYLDIGSDDCMIPVAITDYLRLEKKNSFSSDIVEKCDNDEVTFIHLIPFEHSKLYQEKYFNSFDLFTAFQSFHHIEDIDFRMNELIQLSKQDCIFFIREHDANSNEMKILIDIEHLIYEVLIEGRDYNDFIDNYYSNYMNEEQLKELMKRFNFKRIFKSEPFGFTRYYYSVFVKE